MTYIWQILPPWNHRTAEAGKDLWRSPGLTPGSSKATLSRLPRTMSRWLLQVSEDDSTSLGNLFQCTATATTQYTSASRCLPRSSCVPVYAHCLLSWLHVHCTFPSGICKTLLKSPTEPPLLQTEQSHLSQPFLIGEVLQSLKHLCGPLLHFFHYVPESLAWGSPELNRIKQNAVEKLERTYKDHQVQLADHFRTNLKLQHVIAGSAQTPPEY